jgi:phosphate ABC transporter phosphate-binding protein
MNFYRTATSGTTIGLVVVLVLVVVGAGAYIALSSGGSTPTTTNTSSTPTLSGTLNIAGSTLVFPLMSSWQFGFSQTYPNAIVNYNSIGSGAGIAQITAKTVDIGATDAPLSAKQYAALPATVVTVPESISAVVPAYNLPGIGNGLNFTGPLLAKIFLGNISTWNNQAIQALNPKANLPAHAITVIHRSDGSGTMYTFTNYLSDSNAQWKKNIGYSTGAIAWPTGIGCKGNEGVAGCIETTPYSLGPLEIAYVAENPTLISYGAVENAAGRFITPNLVKNPTTGVTHVNTTSILDAAAAGGTGLPAGNAVWTPISIVNAIYNDTAAIYAYPITTFTYLVTYQAQTSQTQGELVVNFLWWAVNHAQAAGASIGYISLPANVVALDDTTIKSITYNGTPLYTGS